VPIACGERVDDADRPFSTLSPVLASAALAGPLPKLGVVVLAALAATALLAREKRAAAAATLGALVLAPTLLLADIWHSPQLSAVHRHPALAAVAGLCALAVVVALGGWLASRRELLGVLAVLAVPFRIPIQAGGTTSNLLVPLYLVVAAGSLSLILPALVGWPARPSDGGPPETNPDGPHRREPSAPVRWLERLLALYVVLYAIQAIYSADFEKALQQLVFFYVPFTLLYCALRGLNWTPQLLRRCLGVVIGLGVLFVLVGFAEYATKTLFLNPKLIAANDVHAYFTVNSVFFDPDIFGRFLALAMILLAAVLLFGRSSRDQLGSALVLAVLWGGLVLTLSRSSMGALLVGLAILAMSRWDARRTLAAVAAVIVLGVVAVAVAPKTFGLNQGLNGASSGRAGLVSGGLDLFGGRPIWGYGSGSFVHEYQAHHPASAANISASHTVPITIGAEQGLIGEVVYVALVLAALAALLRQTGADPARAAVGAAFVALVFHTMLYADFLEDPVTWTLLGIGVALAIPARARAPELEEEMSARRMRRAEDRRMRRSWTGRMRPVP
jgi:putative inorganic carbon (hco3(-)) transporter